jgi:hypothetical protein
MRDGERPLDDAKGVHVEHVAARLGRRQAEVDEVQIGLPHFLGVELPVVVVRLERVQQRGGMAEHRNAGVQRVQRAFREPLRLRLRFHGGRRQRRTGGAGRELHHVRLPPHPFRRGEGQQQAEDEGEREGHHGFQIHGTARTRAAEPLADGSVYAFGRDQGKSS